MDSKKIIIWRRSNSIAAFMRKLFVLICIQWLVLSASFANNTSHTLIVGYTRAAPFIVTDKDQLEGLSVWLWEKIANDLDLIIRWSS